MEQKCNKLSFGFYPNLNKNMIHFYRVYSRNRSQVVFGFVSTVSDSDLQFRIRKSKTKLENLKAVLSCFYGN